MEWFPSFYWQTWLSHRHGRCLGGISLGDRLRLLERPQFFLLTTARYSQVTNFLKSELLLTSFFFTFRLKDAWHSCFFSLTMMITTFFLFSLGRWGRGVRELRTKSVRQEYDAVSKGGGCVWERGHKGSRYSQPASHQLWIRESTQQAMTKELNGKDEEE